MYLETGISGALVDVHAWGGLVDSVVSVHHTGQRQHNEFRIFGAAECHRKRGCGGGGGEEEEVYLRN